MSAKHWIKRLVYVFAGVFVVLTISEFMKGKPILAALEFAAFWSFITTFIYTGASLYQFRKGRVCSGCEELRLDKKVPGENTLRNSEPGQNIDV